MTIPLENAIDSSRERLICFRCHTQLPNDDIIVDFSAGKVLYSCRSCGNSGWRSFGAVFTTVVASDIVVYTDCRIRTSGVTKIARPSEADQRQAFRQGVWDAINETLQRQPRSPNAPIFRSAPPTFREVIGNDAVVDELRRSIADPAPSPPPVAVIDCEEGTVEPPVIPMAPAEVERLENDIAGEFARRRGQDEHSRRFIQRYNVVTGFARSASAITDSGTVVINATREIVRRNVERQATEAPRQQAVPTVAHPLDALFADMDAYDANRTDDMDRKKPRDDGYDIANDPNSEE